MPTYVDACHSKIFKVLDKYENITQGAFQAKTMFTTGEVCRIFENKN